MITYKDQWYVGWFMWCCRVLDRFCRLGYNREHRYQGGTNLCHFFQTLMWGTLIALASVAMWAYMVYVFLILPFSLFSLGGMVISIAIVAGMIAAALMIVLVILSAPEGVKWVATRTIMRPRDPSKPPGFFGLIWEHIKGIKQRFCPTIAFRHKETGNED